MEIRIRDPKSAVFGLTHDLQDSQLSVWILDLSSQLLSAGNGGSTTFQIVRHNSNYNAKFQCYISFCGRISDFFLKWHIAFPPNVADIRLYEVIE